MTESGSVTSHIILIEDGRNVSENRQSPFVLCTHVLYIWIETNYDGSEKVQGITTAYNEVFFTLFTWLIYGLNLRRLNAIENSLG